MRVPTFLLATILLALPLLFGCGGEKEDKAEPPVEDPRKKALVATPIISPENALAKAAAEKAIEQFSTKLRAELTSAMSGGDIAKAIEVCSQKAPLLAQELNRDGFSIRRVSMFNRNRDNYPTQMEAAYLQRFSNDSTGKPIANWDILKDERIYRYFQPIYMQAMCTSCHGKTEEMDPAVVAKLESLYPKDRAVGMSEGDLRGMFAVAIEWPKGKAQAEKIVNGTSK